MATAVRASNSISNRAIQWVANRGVRYAGWIKIALDPPRRDHFLSRAGRASCYGVYPDFTAARRALPVSAEFDLEDLAREYVDLRCHRLYAYDYPVIHWLGRAFLDGASSVADIGGSVGVHFRAYQRALLYPTGLEWTVYEVPAMVAVGRRLAPDEGPRLQFHEGFDASAATAEIWLSAGALQYLEDGDLGRMLATCASPPRHIILNKMPLYDGEAFVTTQNLGEGCFAPVHVYNGPALIEAAERAGYELIDRWEVLERSLYLPGHPNRSFRRFSGLYFRRRDVNTRS